MTRLVGLLALLAGCTAPQPPLDCSAVATPFRVVRRIPTSQIADTGKRVVGRAPPHGTALDAILYVSDSSQISPLLVEPQMVALRSDGTLEALAQLPRSSSQLAAGTRGIWGVNETGPWYLDVNTKAQTQLPTHAPAGGARFYASDGSRLVVAFETAGSDWEIEQFDEEGTRTVLQSPPPKTPVQAIDINGDLTCVQFLKNSINRPVISCSSLQGTSFEFQFTPGDEAEPAGTRIFVTSTHIVWSSLKTGWLSSPHGQLEPTKVTVSMMSRFVAKDPCGIITGPTSSTTGQWAFVTNSLDSTQVIPVPTAATVDTSIQSGVSNETSEIAILKREVVK